MTNVIINVLVGSRRRRGGWRRLPGKFALLRAGARGLLDRTGASVSTLVRGYQRYNLKNHQVTEILSYKAKFEWIRKSLMRVRDDIDASSLMDIGCSAGLISHL